MTKVVVRLPEPKYLTQQKEDQERFTWLGLG